MFSNIAVLECVFLEERGEGLSLILLSCHNLVMAKGCDLFVSTVNVHVQL